MIDREVMRLALEALQSSQESGSVGVKIDNAITALRQALEQPKREWQGLADEEIAEGAKQSWVDKQAFESAVWWA